MAMTTVEMADALETLIREGFDIEAFPYAFLAAFGLSETTIRRLRAGDSSDSDFAEGVLVRHRIHMLALPPGEGDALLDHLELLKTSTATTRWKVRYVLVTDGARVLAEDRHTGDIIDCAFKELPEHIGTLLALGGVETISYEADSSVDVKATRQLNALYLELQRHNREWGGEQRGTKMNIFFARLIFCLFADDTQIFPGQKAFSTTLRQYTALDGRDTHTIIETLFRVFDVPQAERGDAYPRWACSFPYVNGHLFRGDVAVPHFSRTARSYLLRIASLNWAEINPDIFGSMIQAIVEEDERGRLGLHYTSVGNILKVLNPLFLDDMRAQLEAAGTSKPKLRALRARLARVRVLDPACGSGNFLVIAYKELRAIEAQVDERLGEAGAETGIDLKNFRGIEIFEFPALIARIALIITKYQCDARHLGQLSALLDFLPLDKEHWIVCANALRVDWKEIVPPEGRTAQVVVTEGDLFTQDEQPALTAFENEGGEVYICGNPPYVGSTYQTREQKADMKHVFHGRLTRYASLDYVAAWFMLAADYGEADVAFVSTNSINQGRQVATLWPTLLRDGRRIHFAYPSFKWANLAAQNAGVTVSIVGLSTKHRGTVSLYTEEPDKMLLRRECDSINAYLVPAENVYVDAISKPLSGGSIMDYGNKPTDGGNLLLSYDEASKVLDFIRVIYDSRQEDSASRTPLASVVRRVYGSREFIQGLERYCLWISDEQLPDALQVPEIARRIEATRAMRLASKKEPTRRLAAKSHRFGEIRQEDDLPTIIVPRVSSERREYLPVGLIEPGAVVTDLVFALYDAPIWNLALIASTMHRVWIATVCGKLKNDYRYSNTLGWHTFPVPALTAVDEADLTERAEEILRVREQHFPATLAELYDPAGMPAALREAHVRNDETVERIFAGRRFRHDSERLEWLFRSYEKLVKSSASKGKNTSKQTAHEARGAKA